MADRGPLRHCADGWKWDWPDMLSLDSVGLDWASWSGVHGGMLGTIQKDKSTRRERKRFSECHGLVRHVLALIVFSSSQRPNRTQACFAGIFFQIQYFFRRHD